MKKTKSLFQQLHESNEKIAEQKKDIKECLNCLDKINIMSRLKIQKNKEKIVKLLNENIDLEYNLTVKSMKKIYEKEINAGSKKEPKMVMATFGMWYEYFKDEDTDEKIKIERNGIIAIDGKPSDGWRIIKHYTIDDV